MGDNSVWYRYLLTQETILKSRPQNCHTGDANHEAPIRVTEKGSKVCVQLAYHDNIWPVLEMFMQRPTCCALSATSSDFRFRMVFAYTGTEGDSGGRKYLGLEIETEWDAPASMYAQNVCPPHCVTGQNAIHHGTTLAVQGGESTAVMTPQDSSVPTILDSCVSLSTIIISGERIQIFGSFSDENHRHNMYYIRNLAAGVEMKFLSELIKDSTDFFKASASGHFLTQKQRLRFAVNLACSVLQFHGSWLKTHWRAKDILFNTSIDIENPFIE
ncbi:hypothetical protein N7488_012299 [Penicillium malachiteum]|nr:hypothetical protein N7488_012299 [Penicillium malachiteum]